jgi:L-seryl-tRNA(Ser) seleniumtransferase
MTDQTDRADTLRQLPSVDRLLGSSNDLIAVYGRDAVRDALRVALDAARQWIRQGGGAPVVDELLAAAGSLLRVRQMPSLRPVINATGVILHTNLGRAPLCESARQAMLVVAEGYSTLEYDLEEGERGKRDRHAEAILTAITGAEAALVVNNNAAAILLILSALADGRDVIISRGQLVEIGGGFRVPEVMIQSGARLVEVGTTNRTRLEDYEHALNAGNINPALIMRAHASNFKQIGFTEQPELRDLAKLAHARSIYAIDDLGSGALLDTTAYGLDHEPTPQDSLQAGFDLAAFSGDKLLGGPQAGIIVGRASLVERLKRHPLARAVRIDKLCLAALVSTLEHYRRGDAAAHIPVWQMIALGTDAIRARAEAWAANVGGDVIRSESTIGGGSLPGETLPTFALALDVSHPDTLAVNLRRQPNPVIARIARDRLLFDPRTVMPDQDQALLQSLTTALSEGAR